MVDCLGENYLDIMRSLTLVDVETLLAGVELERTDGLQAWFAAKDGWANCDCSSDSIS